jgi:hypothetical protein
MYIEYNGVTLQLVDFIKRERDLVYDPSGVDVIYVKHIIGAVCTIARGGWPTGTEALSVTGDTIADVENPDGLSDSIIPNPASRGTPNYRTEQFSTRNQRGLLPIYTDADLRIRLLAPRKLLKIYGWGESGGNGQNIWLQAPTPGAKVDAAGGPFPRALDVIDSSGEPNSMAVYFEIEANVPPCHSGEDQLILSHRWQMTHTHDEDYYLTRIINGTVIFNAAQVHAKGINPDWLRNQFIHPIPLGYKRGLPEITQSPDGHTIRYTITDTDEKITFAPADTGATQIQIIEKLTHTSPLVTSGQGGSGGGSAPGWWGRQWESIKDLSRGVHGFFMDMIPGNF